MHECPDEVQLKQRCYMPSATLMQIIKRVNVVKFEALLSLFYAKPNFSRKIFRLFGLRE